MYLQLVPGAQDGSLISATLAPWKSTCSWGPGRLPPPQETGAALQGSVFPPVAVQAAHLALEFKLYYPNEASHSQSTSAFNKHRWQSRA